MEFTCNNCLKHENCKIEEWYFEHHWARKDFGCNEFTNISIAERIKSCEDILLALDATPRIERDKDWDVKCIQMEHEITVLKSLYENKN